MYITLSGRLGSGKSTVASRISNLAGYEIYSTGKIQRGIAERLNITTLELNELMKTKPEYDDIIDRETVRISKESVGKKILFDSRLAFHFVEDSLKVYTYVSPLIAGERVVNDARGAVEHYESAEEARDGLLERTRVENLRFADIYAIDNLDYRNYNLIVDSTYIDPDQVFEEMKAGMEAYEKDPQMRRIRFSPKSLYPTVPYEELDQEKVEEYLTMIREGEELPLVKVAGRDFLFYVTEGCEVLAAAQKAGAAMMGCELDEAFYSTWDSEEKMCSKRIEEREPFDLRILEKNELEKYETEGVFSYKD